MNKLIDEQKKKAIAPDPISAAAGGVQAANATKAALVNQASARPAWAASSVNPSPAPQGQQAYQMFSPATSATNQQLQTAREGVGANAAPMEKSLTQMVQSIDPRIRTQAQERQAWRMMTPQQRRDKIGMAKIQQEARTAKDVMENSPGWEQLADASGTSLDSYGNSEQFYTPDQIEYKRQAMREFDKEWADVLSNVDKTAFADPKAAYQLQEQLPSVKKYGDFLGSYRFNAIRKFATPQMKAQMEAEDRNQKAFEQTFTAKAAEEIVTRMAQEGKVNPAYANGYKFTNEGSKEFATQIWLNRDSDPRAGQIVNEIMANAPVMWMEEGGRVVQDPAHQERRRMMLEDRKNQMAEKSKKDERDAAIRAEQIKYSGIQEMNPEYAKGMKWNEVTGSYDDLNKYAPEKQETNWDEIYQNDDRIAAAEATLSWARFTNEAEAAAEAARQFPTRPDLPPTDAINQNALYAQQQAVNVWRTQVNPPEKRAELEREIYNLKLRGQELRKGFKNPPQTTEPASVPQSVENITLNSPAESASSPAAPQSRQSQPAYREVPLGSGKKQNRQNYEKAGTFRVGTLPDESIYEQYKATGRVSVSSGEIDKIPVSVSVAGKNEYITMVDPSEFSSFMKKQGVGALSPVKVRVIPIDDIAEISASDKEVESMRTRFGISPFASKKQVLAVAADRINSENKKRVHPFKNLLDWSPDLEWFQA